MAACTPRYTPILYITSSTVCVFVLPARDNDRMSSHCGWKPQTSEVKLREGTLIPVCSWCLISYQRFTSCDSWCVIISNSMYAQWKLTLARVISLSFLHVLIFFFFPPGLYMITAQRSLSATKQRQSSC